jgi:hypothetical protein
VIHQKDIIAQGSKLNAEKDDFALSFEPSALSFFFIY